jgi:hypothetical protein
MKIHPVGAELFHVDGWTDRQTDMTKLMVAFRNFANTPKTISTAPRADIWQASLFLWGEVLVCHLDDWRFVSQDRTQRSKMRSQELSSIAGLLLALTVQRVQQYCHSTADCGHIRISEPIVTCSQGSAESNPQIPTPPPRANRKCGFLDKAKFQKIWILLYTVTAVLYAWRKPLTCKEMSTSRKYDSRVICCTCGVWRCFCLRKNS